MIKKEDGFTLVEIMTVIIIIAIQWKASDKIKKMVVMRILCSQMYLW